MGWVNRLSAVVAFIYFAHTTLIALEESIPDYETLWGLGDVYIHGGLMVAGGMMFGIDSLRAQVLWRGAVGLFIAGITLNLAVALLPLPDILQILGSSVRNLGLMTMGISVMRQSVLS